MTASLRRPSGILFDLDDTLISDSANADANWSHAIVAAGAVIAFPIEAVTEAVLSERRWYWSDPERHRSGRLNLVETHRSIIRAALASVGVPPSDLPALEVAIVAAYRALSSALRAPLPGALDALVALREMGIKLALLTNGASQPQRAKIDQFGLASLVDEILIEGEIGAGKPDPSVYRLAITRLGIEPHQTWMIGDNLEWDVMAPRQLGITGLWVSPELADADASAADAVLSDLAALIPLLASLDT